MSDDHKISEPLRQILDLTSPEAMEYHRKLAVWFQENKTFDPWSSAIDAPFKDYPYDIFNPKRDGT